MALPSSLDWVHRVAMTVVFSEPLSALQSEHIGLLWYKVREEYPKVEQTPPDLRSLSPSRLLSSVARGQFPMPGFHFSSFDGSSTLLVEQGRLQVSWARDPGDPMDFEGYFVPSFRKAANLFEDFVREELDVPWVGMDLCELTFAGGFEFQSTPRAVELTQRSLGVFKAPEIDIPFSRDPQFICTYYYDLESGLHIQIDGELDYVENSSTRSLFSLQFEGSERMMQARVPEVEEWLRSTHKFIFKCYLSLFA